MRRRSAGFSVRFNTRIKEEKIVFLGIFTYILIQFSVFSRLDQYKVVSICCAQAQFVFKILWCSNRKKSEKRRTNTVSFNSIEFCVFSRLDQYKGSFDLLCAGAVRFFFKSPSRSYKK